MRVAGGWVRDKILEKDADDIDIALDIMSGETFASEFKQFMVERNDPHLVSGMGVIKANPDKS